MEDERVPWYDFVVNASARRAILNIYGPIGGGFFAEEDAPSGKRVAKELAELGDDVREINVRVNSPGGNVFDGLQIANALKRERDENGRDVIVEIEALAASAATLITSAGSEIRMPENAVMMIHNPSGFAWGDAKTMRSTASALDKIRNAMTATYRWVSSLSAKELRALLDAETWMSADEALENGFITEITDEAEAEAKLTADAFEKLHVPEEWRERVAAMVRPDSIQGIAPEISGTVESPKPSPPAITAETPKSEEPMEPKPNPVTPTPEPAPNVDEIKAQAKAQAKAAERKRATDINAACEKAIAAGLKPDQARTMARTAIDSDQTVDEYRDAAFEALAAQSDELPPNGGASHPELIADESDKRVTGITAALLVRSGVDATIREAMAREDRAPGKPEFQSVELDPGEFRGMSLLDFARDDMDRRGKSWRGMTPSAIANEFFAHSAGGYQTTSDFKVALENALNKTLLAAYEIAPDTWRGWCAVGSVNDFRDHPHYQRGYLARLPVVPESGEIKNQPIPDAAKEVLRANEHGNIIALTRQTIINDDMGVFNDIAMMLGRTAGLTIELTAYDLLKQNGGLGPNMQDGNPLFDASHNNINTSASALDVAGIEADRHVMARQKDLADNEFLDIRPYVLLVSTEQGGTARVVNDQQYDTDGPAGQSKFMRPNMVRGLFNTVVDTPQLTGNRRYLFTNPTAHPVMKVGFLDGQQAPTMAMSDGWRFSGVEWRILLDFGVAAVAYTGSVTNAGA